MFAQRTGTIWSSRRDVCPMYLCRVNFGKLDIWWTEYFVKKLRTCELLAKVSSFWGFFSITYLTMFFITYNILIGHIFSVHTRAGKLMWGKNYLRPIILIILPFPKLRISAQKKVSLSKIWNYKKMHNKHLDKMHF